MGGCVSVPNGHPLAVVSAAEKANHIAAEKVMLQAKAKMAHEVKVLLLGSGDSGKSTILKQMRIIHKLPWTAGEIESYRQLVYENLTSGLKTVLDAMDIMDIEPSKEVTENGWVKMIEQAQDLKDGQAFPLEYLDVLSGLWKDPSIQQAIARGNEAALPENLPYFFDDLTRLFKPDYQPSRQDILMTRARTIGITETTFTIGRHELLMVDVGGQKTERRKWIHCFEDVTAIVFLASLSGYDQCLVEDRDANQMQDAMTIWDSICNSQWFEDTPFILFLNKYDLFKSRVKVSPIKTYFCDYEGPEKDHRAGREYFKKRFGRLAAKSGRDKGSGREIFLHITTATDTTHLKVVMAAVEDLIVRGNLSAAAFM
ncbi:guanine nucleotide binding protein, alpha subunit [Flagelloscypha sp. PMI_526]|nr:guanine nucleotide binding protein, alpha subunit [Flagelloscypha sp. PMI_526]